MGRFNLNQILSETSKAAAGGGSAKPSPAESRYEKLSVFDLVPSEDNFYSMREIGELKAAIEIAGKVLQNLVVVPLGDGKYKVIAGHRRRLASIELVNDGKPEYEFVPCVIEPTEEAADEQEIRDGLDLIVTNSQREKTAWDKIEEVRYLREVLEKAKTKPRFVELLRRIVEKTFEDGELQTDGTRDFIAKVLHTSTTQIGRYDTIIRHLSPEFTEELKADRINLSTAYELAGLPAENQNAAFKEYHLTGAISIKAAREWKRPAPPAPPAEDTATPTQAERPQKEQEPVVERDKVPDTQATPPYSAAVERDTADGTQDTKPTESTQQSAPRRPQANINVTYYTQEGGALSADTIAADVAAAVKSFQKWQAEKMGRDVNPSQLIALLMQTGVKRVEVRSPVFTTVADNAVAQIGTVSVVNGGAERE